MVVLLLINSRLNHTPKFFTFASCFFNLLWVLEIVTIVDRRRFWGEKMFENNVQLCYGSRLPPFCDYYRIHTQLFVLVSLHLQFVLFIYCTNLSQSFYGHFQFLVNQQRRATVSIINFQTKGLVGSMFETNRSRSSSHHERSLK